MSLFNTASTAEAVYSDAELVKKLRALKTWTLIGKLAIPVCGVAGFAAMVFFSIQEAWVPLLVSIALAAATMFVLFIMASGKVSKLKGLMGDAVTLPVLKELFEVNDYAPNGHVDASTIHSAGLVSDWDEISGSDFVKGRYKGVNVLFSDVLLRRKEVEKDSDGKKTTKYVTVFKGQWMVCDFEKELAATVRLIERKGGGKFNRTNDISKSSIETEDVAFNKKYRILTGDGHTAFYLLTPHFMERLMSADDLASAQTLFCFTGRNVHSALYSGRDSFELKGVKLDNLDNVRQKFRNDLKYITDFIDELLLNDKLFKEA